MHEKLKATPGIYLVGFMGCGKTTAGRLLAQELGWDFVDLDEEIERHAEAPIADIFDRLGEPAFRILEHQALTEQAHHVRMGRARVVALGGGAFVDEKNRERLEDAGVSIWLDAGVERLWKRASENDERPLARERAAFESLLAERRPYYERAAFRVDANRSPQEIVEQILALGLL